MIIKYIIIYYIRSVTLLFERYFMSNVIPFISRKTIESKKAAKELKTLHNKLSCYGDNSELVVLLNSLVEKMDKNIQSNKNR